jgi:hypothetical protein
MAIDYREVLKDLRAEEARLAGELETIRSTIPGVELLAKRVFPETINLPLPVRPITAKGKYSDMGPKEAISQLLGEVLEYMMPSDIAKTLLDGGVVTKSGDFVGMVGTILTQMKGDGLVERSEYGWKLKNRVINPPMNLQPRHVTY